MLFEFCQRTTEALNIVRDSDPLYSGRKIKMDIPLIPALNSGIAGVGRAGRRYYYFLMAALFNRHVHASIVLGGRASIL